MVFLLYIKPALNGTEPADVFHYARLHPQFPHEPTSQQLYTESQFESYRELGSYVHAEDPRAPPRRRDARAALRDDRIGIGAGDDAGLRLDLEALTSEPSMKGRSCQTIHQHPRKTNRVLVKLRSSNALRAADSSSSLEPLYDTPQVTAGGFGLDSGPQWFIAELPGGAATPWDLAHTRVAAQLGISESDVIFAEARYPPYRFPGYQ